MMMMMMMIIEYALMQITIALFKKISSVAVCMQNPTEKNTVFIVCTIKKTGMDDG
jgi:hypothetical protein